MNKFNIQVRKDIIEMIGEAQSGYPGGSLSVVEILSVLYNKVMRIDPKKPTMPDRDIFVLSKGHASAALYSVLARKGFFPVEYLKTFRKFKSKLQGHPDRNKLTGVEVSTGSLGQGVSIAAGMALGYKKDKKPNKVYAAVGDGEIQEGQFWEASMAAAHYKLSNFTIIIDKNNLQIDGPTDEVMSVGDVGAKMLAFGFDVYEVDGHDEERLYDVLMKNSSDKPKCIIANTIKGKGVTFMENKFGWHGKAPSKEEVFEAIKELDKL